MNIPVKDLSPGDYLIHYYFSYGLVLGPKTYEEHVHLIHVPEDEYISHGNGD